MASAPPPFSWTSGEVHAEVLVGVALLGALWLWQRRRESRGGARRDALLFGGGLLAIVAALNGPVHDLSDGYLFSAHMVQHLVLTLVVPPLLLAGTPGFVLDAALRPLLAHAASRPLVRVPTHPLGALAVYTIALVGWHLPGPYNAALETHGWHIVEHLTLLAASTLAWWPILSRSTLAPALPYAAQLLYLFVFGMPMTVVGAMVTAAERPLFPLYVEAPRLFALSPLADQRLGGVIMWVPAGIIPVVVFTAVFFRWAAAEAEDHVEPLQNPERIR
jgi:putative membrane protein